MELKEIKQYFEEQKEEAYQKFTFSLASSGSLPLLGVRLPILRKLAKRVAADDGEAFLRDCDFSSVEMTCLYSYVLGEMKLPVEKLLFYFSRAVPHIDCWNTCDTLCQSFRQARIYREEVWNFLMGYALSDEQFPLRVVAVTLMSHFLTEEYVDRVLDFLARTQNDGYYYKMGAAWALATVMAKFPEKAKAFLLGASSWDDWTYNKAIQKMLESYRVSELDKEWLRARKRPVSSR